jgi:hypothetical protein
VKRSPGAGLFGIGALLLVFAAGLLFHVGPAVRQLPYDLEASTSVAEATDAKFLQVKDGVPEINSGRLRSTVEVLPQAKVTLENLPGDLKGTTVVWDVYQTVSRAGTNETVSAYSTELAIDRRSGAAAPWDSAWLKDGTELPASYSGQVYKFPFGTEKRDYPVYDRDVRRAVPARFKGVETIKAVKTYVFEQVVPSQKVVVADSSLKVLLTKFAPRATGGQVMYRNTRTLWVEPTTGAYIAQHDRPHKELVPDDGSAPTVLLDADFTYDEKTATASLARAKDNAQKVRLVSFWAPVALGVIGLIVMLVAVILVLRRGRREERHQASAGTVPPARRVSA